MDGCACYAVRGVIFLGAGLVEVRLFYVAGLLSPKGGLLNPETLNTEARVRYRCSEAGDGALERRNADEE